MFILKTITSFAVTARSSNTLPSLLIQPSQWNSFRYLRYSSMADLKIRKRYDNITKSAEDKRLYRGLELENDLKVILVSDPTTDKSSAAMDVNIGHLSDPDDLPGLAHFCEHMLFLGTEKYPEENAYSKYLNEHAGMCNAYTSGEHTNYYFDCSPDGLAGALDRFTQFFHSPLFTPSATEREVNAVNSENDKNLAQDGWRIMQLEKSTLDPEHPYSKFGTGNRDTLLTIPSGKGVDTRDELLKFHGKFYSSNIMGLAVLGKESLDELEQMVIPLFNDVSNKSVTVPEWNNHPVKEEHTKMEARVIPIKDMRNLHVSWPLPDLHDYYHCNPGHYLGHLLGHEGPGSLLSELKKRGWVNTLLGGQKDGGKGFMFFMCNVDLSEEGIEHVYDIIGLMFQYLDMLRKEGPQEWIFKECQDLSAMSFRFKDKESPRNYTSHLAGELHMYPVDEILTGDYILTEYKPELIQMVLDKLTPENIRVSVIGKKYESETDLTEKWYGTKYSMTKISDEYIQKWKTQELHPNLKLPARNEFIPTNFDILPKEEEKSPMPLLLRDTSMSRVWYKQDDKFLLPKSFMNIDLTSPNAYVDPLATSLTYMFVALFRDALNEYTYDAELAGLDFHLGNTIYGLTLSLSGYNDKQHILLKKLLEKMTSFDICPQRFNILLENYIRGLKNFRAEQPHQHAIYYTSVLTAEQMWTKEEILEATEELTLDKLRSFIPTLLSRLHLEYLIYGNVTQQKALEIADLVESFLSSHSNTKPLLPSQRRRFREVQMPDGCSFVYKKENDVHKSSSLEVYYQCSTQETLSNVLLELFCQIVQEPCFDILRTQEQLGYIVFSGIRRSSGVQGLRVIVQSDKNPQYVEERIEAFLHKMGQMFEEMEGDQFDKHKEALIVKRLEKPKKMSSQKGRYWSEIISQQYNFDRDEIEVAQLRKLQKSDIIKFYKELIAHDAPRRHKLSVHVASAITPQVDDQSEVDNGTPEKPLAPPPQMLCQCEEIEDVCHFKRDLGLFPLAKPYFNFNANKSKL